MNFFSLPTSTCKGHRRKAQNHCSKLPALQHKASNLLLAANEHCVYAHSSSSTINTATITISSGSRTRT
jgi:hypothetical protein